LPAEKLPATKVNKCPGKMAKMLGEMAKRKRVYGSQGKLKSLGKPGQQTIHGMSGISLCSRKCPTSWHPFASIDWGTPQGKSLGKAKPLWAIVTFQFIVIYHFQKCIVLNRKPNIFVLTLINQFYRLKSSNHNCCTDKNT